jgi:hypothetical protein
MGWGDVMPFWLEEGDVQAPQHPTRLWLLCLPMVNAPLWTNRWVRDYHLSTGPASGFKASMRLPTLKRLRSGQRRRPAQTPGPSLSGAVARRCGLIPAGPECTAEYLSQYGLY